MFQPIESVMQIVAEKTANGQFCTVEFVKSDGTIRKANVALSPKSKLKGIGKVGAQLAYVSGFEVGTQKWISFDPTKVLSIK